MIVQPECKIKLKTLLTFAPSIVMEDSLMFCDSALQPKGSWDRLQPQIVTLHQRVNQQRFPSVYKNIIGGAVQPVWCL